jgi:hypothetical protein
MIAFCVVQAGATYFLIFVFMYHCFKISFPDAKKMDLKGTLFDTTL